jgi:membrane protease YdiL (CAAX protease family)
MKNLAQRGLLIYFTILIVGSSVIEWLLIKTGDPIKNHVTLVLLLMWTPAIASFVARAALREGFHDVSFRFGGRRTMKPILTGWFFPLAVGTIAYGFAWSTGLASFITQGVRGLPTFETPILSFLFLALVRLSIGVIIAAIAAAGEEIGWRGYMLTRLIQAGVPFPLLVSGLIWGLWHTPLIIAGQYASGPYPFASAGLFVVGIVAAAFLFARLRLESGSVWPCIIGHAAWNSTIQGVFDFSSAGASKELWIGESGILVAAVSVVLVWFLVRGKWPRLSAPNEPLLEEAA